MHTCSTATALVIPLGLISTVKLPMCTSTGYPTSKSSRCASNSLDCQTPKSGSALLKCHTTADSLSCTNDPSVASVYVSRIGIAIIFQVATSDNIVDLMTSIINRLAQSTQDPDMRKINQHTLVLHDEAGYSPTQHTKVYWRNKHVHSCAVPFLFSKSTPIAEIYCMEARLWQSPIEPESNSENLWHLRPGKRPIKKGKIQLLLDMEKQTLPPFKEQQLVSLRPKVIAKP